MNKENKRPPFVTYVRCRHTGTSPYKPNLGIPTVKPKRPNNVTTVIRPNNQQDRVGPISRIPQLNVPRRIAQQEPRSQLPIVRRNVNGRVARRNEGVPETGRGYNIEPTPLAETDENPPEIEREEDINLSSLATTIERTPEIEREEDILLDPQSTRIEITPEIVRNEGIDLALLTTPENAPDIERDEAILLDQQSTTIEITPEIEREEDINLSSLATTIEISPEIERNEDIDLGSLATIENAPEIEGDETFESAPLAAGNGRVSLTEIPLVLEVIEESPIPRFSLCHETQNIYRMKLQMETTRLSKIADQWEEIKAENELESDIQDDIDAAVGQTRLLLRSKFEQFKGLIDLYPTSNDIRPGDLGGFWDMIYIQVELLDSHFAKLQKLKDNNWVEDMPQVQAKKKTKRGGKKKRNIKVKSKFREAMALRNNAEEPSTSVCPLPPGSPAPSNETITQEVPQVGTPRVNRIIERARQTRRSSIGIVIRSSLTGKIF